jgi:hypothetical protein
MWNLQIPKIQYYIKGAKTHSCIYVGSVVLSKHLVIYNDHISCHLY